MQTMTVTCIDCGASCTGDGKPKEIAKRNGWRYVTKGKWRCGDCQAFQNGMNEQFGEDFAGTVIIPGRGTY